MLAGTVGEVVAGTGGGEEEVVVVVLAGTDGWEGVVVVSVEGSGCEVVLGVTGGEDKVVVGIDEVVLGNDWLVVAVAAAVDTGVVVVVLVCVPVVMLVGDVAAPFAFIVSSSTVNNSMRLSRPKR